MLRIKKAFAVVCAAFTLFLQFFSFAAAEKETQTRTLYYQDAATSIAISSTGNCVVTISYSITNNYSFTDAEIHTYVERLTFGVFWVKVNNGQPNNEWVATPTTTSYSNNYTLQLTQTGTYRSVAEFTFNGSQGSEPVYKSASTIY